MRVCLLFVIFVVNFLLIEVVFCQNPSVDNIEETMEWEKWMRYINSEIEKRTKASYLQHNEKELQIAVSKNVFVPVEPVRIDVSMRNTASSARKYYTSSWRTMIGYCKKNEKMRQPSDYISNVQLNPIFVNCEMLSEPNQFLINNSIVINKEVDITLEGEYLIQMFHVDILNFENNKSENNIEPSENTDKISMNMVKVKWTKSNVITIKINDSLVDFSKVIPPNMSRTFTKPLHGISFSLVSDNFRYDNYGPVYFRIATKNVSDNSVSMIVDTKNILDVYDLVLLTPGDNLDFRKPSKKDKSDVQKVEYTLYGQKLVSEKSKTPKPLVSVKPNEETAESIFVLNRIFDMSTDGIYGLIVTRKIIDSTGKEQTISSEPFPIRIGQSLTQDEIDERVKQRRLEGNDPDYPIWRSSDGLFKVIAKFISVDKDVVTLEKIDGKKITFNVSDLTKENQDYIKNKKNPVIE
jgi:hypothetical protein